jgi:hypothetical protein
MRAVAACCLVLLSVALSGCGFGRGVSGLDNSNSTPLITPATTDVTPTFAGCAYVWASHELPDVSDLVQAAFKAAGLDATGSANAYGEDCVYEDGTRTFSAMETDFRVKLAVADVKDQQELGNSVSAVMNVLEKVPKDRLAGPQPGRVEFEFADGNALILRLTVDIGRYRREASGTSGARLFKLFYTNP